MDAIKKLKEAISLFPRGQWYSPDTTAKKETWFVSVAHGQAVGMPTIGGYVWVSKSRGAYQVLEVTEVKGEHVDKMGLKRTLYVGRIISDI